MVSIYVYNIWTKQQIFKSEVSQVAWAIKVSMTGDPPDQINLTNLYMERKMRD